MIPKEDPMMFVLHLQFTHEHFGLYMQSLLAHSHSCPNSTESKIRQNDCCLHLGHRLTS